jgi:hypothetical protein
MGNSPLSGCSQCEEALERLRAFGRGYLDDILTQEEAEEKATKNLWYNDAREMIEFLKGDSV